MNPSTARQILIILVALTLFALPAVSGAIMQESVKNAVSQNPASTYIELLISFENDLDLAVVKMDRLREKLDRASNYRDIMGRLVRNRQALEDNILPQLKAMKALGNVESYKFYTVSKTILVRTRVDNIDNLMQLPGVRLINLNQPVSLIKPVEESEPSVFTKATLSNSALDAINVRTLWERGLTGSGSIICSFDTGIDGDHPALGAKWRGNNGASAAESWFAPRGDATPYDNIGHGSHVMGVMLGSTASDTIGVAPGAQWISAAVIDQGASFSATIADILSAFDWALNPDGDIYTTDDLPDVICNSWGVPRGIFSDCDNTFWTAIDNIEAAGIVTIFAAGNEGPTAKSMRNPADRASSPLNTLSVGAVDPQTLLVAEFSSRGPASCDGFSIKPELVAPGVSIYSSYKDGGYKVMSGTSMATPFVAGMVALMRQYNPEATVQEIKAALIQATIDLGLSGEDNDYGHGIIDASRILDFLPPPEMPNITIYRHHLYSGGDDFADPGEIAEMTLTLNEPTALVDSVDVWVSSMSESITTTSEIVRYRFAQGATYAASLNPFYLEVSPDAISGSDAELMVHLRFMNGLGEDSIVHSIDVGHMMPGRIFAVNAGEMTLSASDFGQLGFGQGSIYQAGGEGLRFRDSANLLYEAGLIIGRSAQMVSDAVRGADGQFKVSDFIPEESDHIFATGFDENLTDVFADENAAFPIPVRVEQAIYQSEQNYAIVQISVINPTPERIDHLAMGWLYDFDIDRQNDQIGFDYMMGMLYHYNAEQGVYLGIVGVSANEFAYTAYQNINGEKQGLIVSEKYDLVNRTGVTVNDSTAGDWLCTISRTADQIDGFGRCKMAIVLAAGESLEALRAAAQAGMNEYDIYLDVEEEWVVLPSTMGLSQNYPNPFNPRTTIRFALGSAQRATLNVYNVTGQKVRTLFEGMVQAGEQSIVWDGRDDFGRNVASGIYFYRLSTGEETRTRKMVFLK